MSPLGVDWVDRTRGARIAAAPLVRFLRTLARLEPAAPGASIGVCLVGDRTMRRLNREWRGKDRTTDVLSFPAGETALPEGGRHLGDVVISVDRARSQARERGHPLSRELRVLLAHGYLHLLGYDHERDDGTMMRRQARLLRRAIPRGTRR